MQEVAAATIVELIENAAKRWPDLEALVEDDVRWTFPQLAERVHEATRALMASGVNSGDRVSVWAPNIREWVVVALATYSAGAVLIPINTRYKAREASYIVRKGRVKIIFTVTDFLDTDYVQMIRSSEGSDHDFGLDEIVVLRGNAPAGTVSFDSFLTRAAATPEPDRAARASSVTSNDLCHVLFTSGTTGAPKGVMLQHGAICRAYLGFSDTIGLRTGDRYLIVNPFFHSFGLHAGILCCLMMGATMLPHLVFDPRVVMHRIADERVTAFPGPPTVYQGMLNQPDVDSVDLSSLRVAVLGAAAISDALVRELRERLHIGTVVTGYGLTEASGIVTISRHDADPEVVANTAGLPLPGVEIKVVGADGNEVDPGQPGELYVRGYNVMRGYLDEPEQTTATIDADGWMRTGDVVYIREDGNMVVTDRIKDMFIVGGFNAYPAEIESLMTRHPEIAQVAVIGVPDDRLGEVAMAFVIARAGTNPQPERIIEWCREEMANFKAPRYVRIVNELPLNATGKVLKYELRERAKQLIA